MSSEELAAIDFEKPLEPYVRRKVVRFFAEGMCYRLEDERLDRISEGMGAYMQEGAHAALAFSEALDDELLLHGEPAIPREHHVPLRWIGAGYV